MPPPAAHKISSSNHKLYHEALRLASAYVYGALVYGAALLVGAAYLSGVPLGLLLGLQDAPPEERHAEVSSTGARGWVQTGALSLGTAGMAGVLMAGLVRRCCRLDRGQGVVVTNWHDLFKYTQLGRTITAAMTAVLAWRGLQSFKDAKANNPGGGAGLAPTILMGAAALSMAVSASMNFLHFRIKAVHVEYEKLKRS